jgi:SAM-dependent methyltransferase
VTQDVPAPSRVLDLGCDNGVLTCFYAIRFPKAKVVGIDRCLGAISCARELVNRLELDNVEFEQIDIQHSPRILGEGSFDLAFATCSLKEVQPFPEVDAFSSFDFSGAEPSSNYAARAVSAVLSPTKGSFVSMERCRGLGDLAWWVKSLNGAGLSLDWERGTFLSFQADGKSETLPILVARNDKPVRISPEEDILAFQASQQFIQLHPVYEGYAAEAFFRAVNPKQLVRGAEIVFRDGGGTERFEIWTADSLLITYQYSTRGFRRFAVGSKVFLSSGISILEQYAEEKVRDADVHFFEASEGMAGVEKR